MPDELDLDRGDPARAEERRARRAARTSSKTSASASGESKTNSDKLDRELHSRLVGSLEQIQEWRQARDDNELAAAIEQDKDKMAKGLVSLTHAVVPLRKPLLVFLGFVEPVLAFGRVGRILTFRWVERRQRMAEERMAQEAQQSEWNVEMPPGVVVNP